MTSTLYTTPAQPEALRSRASRGRWWLIGIGLIVVLIASIALTSRPTDYRTLSVDNYTDSGGRAVAQILGDQGVAVRQYDTLAKIFIPDPDRTTLVVAGAEQLADAQAESIAEYEGDVVFIGASPEVMLALGGGLDVTYDFLPENASAECDDPDATAAEEARLEWVGIVQLDATDATLCFGGRSEAYGMAVIDTPVGTRTVVANSDIFLNANLGSLGHAALALRTTGHHENVAWYLASFYDSTLLAQPGDGDTAADFDATPDFLPPGFGTGLYALAFAALVAAFWRGRRFGLLAVEPLPVVVRASEATRGRARLYRRARAYGRATAALRAASARRMGVRLGVPRTTTRDGMVAAIHRATGRTTADVAHILYGPPPATEADMINVVEQLDALEGEVHRQ